MQRKSEWEDELSDDPPRGPTQRLRWRRARVRLGLLWLCSSLIFGLTAYLSCPAGFPLPPLQPLVFTTVGVLLLLMLGQLLPLVLAPLVWCLSTLPPALNMAPALLYGLLTPLILLWLVELLSVHGLQRPLNARGGGWAPLRADQRGALELDPLTLSRGPFTLLPTLQFTPWERANVAPRASRSWWLLSHRLRASIARHRRPLLGILWLFTLSCSLLSAIPLGGPDVLTAGLIYLSLQLDLSARSLRAAPPTRRGLKRWLFSALLALLAAYQLSRYGPG